MESSIVMTFLFGVFFGVLIGLSFGMTFDRRSNKRTNIYEEMQRYEMKMALYELVWDKWQEDKKHKRPMAHFRGEEDVNQRLKEIISDL